MVKDVRMQGFHELTLAADALNIFFSHLSFTPNIQTVPLDEALNRTLAEDIISEVDIPPFDRAAMDGFAVRAEDTFGASPENPITLQIIGSIEIGDVPSSAVREGTAIRISTGAPMPEGADAVVMIEHAEMITDEMLHVMQSVSPNKNVAKKGEDVTKGTRVLKKGTIIRPFDLALLKSIGLEQVKVYKQPTIAILSTGNELMEHLDLEKKGKIVDSNKIMIKSLVKEDGGIPIDLGIARDDKEEIKMKIQAGLQQADAVMVSGGTSVGSKDFVPLVINELGNPGVLIHGVAISPGRPMGLAIIDNKPILLFPGYPVAVVLNYELFARPLMQALQGHSYKHRPGELVSGKMKKRISGSPGIKDFVRVMIEQDEDGTLWFTPIRRRGAGILSSITRADALLEIPEDSEGYPEGTSVQAKLLRFF